MITETHELKDLAFCGRPRCGGGQCLSSDCSRADDSFRGEVWTQRFHDEQDLADSKERRSAGVVAHGSQHALHATGKFLSKELRGTEPRRVRVELPRHVQGLTGIDETANLFVDCVDKHSESLRE